MCSLTPATIMAALRDSWQVQTVVRACCLPRALPPTALSCTRLAPCKATPPPPTRTPVHTFVRHEQRAVRHVGGHGADVQATLRCLSTLHAARCTLLPHACSPAGRTACWTLVRAPPTSTAAAVRALLQPPHWPTAPPPPASRCCSDRCRATRDTAPQYSPIPGHPHLLHALCAFYNNRSQAPPPPPPPPP